jgi:hypothetical protein
MYMLSPTCNKSTERDASVTDNVEVNMPLTKHHASDIRWRVVSVTLLPLYPSQMSHWNTLGRKAGGSQCCSGCGDEKKKPDLAGN